MDIKQNDAISDIPYTGTMVTSGLVKSSPEEEAIRLIGEVASPIIEKLTEGQRFAAEEGTKRLKLIVDANLKLLWAAIIVSVLIIGLAYVAIFKGDNQLTEKLIFLVVGFFAGMGFTKSGKKGAD